MPKTVLLDELSVTVRIPAGLPAHQVRTVRRTLTGKAFLSKLSAAVRKLVRSRPELSPARVTLGR